MSETNGVRILGPNGQPLAPSRRPPAALLPGGGGPWGSWGTPYDAANITDGHLASWAPMLWSADTALNPWRDRIVSRARDLARNDGWASGTVTRLLDNAIGAQFRPISRPDWRALRLATGNKGFDEDWASAFARAVDAHWRIWADDVIGKWCDVEQKSWMSEILGIAFRHVLIDNDALAIIQERPERVMPGGARYETCVALIDPDRLSNPQNRFDMLNCRGGVEVDADGRATGYHIRKAHQGDWYAAAQSVVWDLVPRWTEDMDPIVVHFWEKTQAAEHRGGAGIFTAVLTRLRMLFKYDGAELDAAIINAYFAAVAESPTDPQFLGEALGEGDMEALNGFQQLRSEFHDTARLEIAGSKVLKLFPGEKLTTVKSERPNPNFPAFEAAFLRNVAAATGAAATQVSQNWADMNYSSARAELLEAWKTTVRRRTNFGHGFGSPIRAAWMAESFEIDDLPLPPGAPPFHEFRQAYSRCVWMGPGRGVIDSVQERKGSVLGMDAGLTTLRHELAEQSGEEVEDVLDERAREVQMFKDRGLPPPTWANIQDKDGAPGVKAEQTIADPEAA